MPTRKIKAVKKKTPVKKEKSVAIENLEEKKVEKYFYAVGKRKTSVAQVRIYPAKEGKSSITINMRGIKDYFPIERLQSAVILPLAATGQLDKADVKAQVSGGGLTGQAEAVRLGIARALVVYDGTLRKSLRDLGLMTRDARKVERKKPGFKKARRSPQWAKR